VARTGQVNGRMAAIHALREIPGPEADAALATLRAELGETWVPYLR